MRIVQLRLYWYLQGHYGSVYVGWIKLPRYDLKEEEQEKKVAIKTLKATAKRNGSIIKELMTAASLEHDNIVKLLYCCFNREFFLHYLPLY